VTGLHKLAVAMMSLCCRQRPGRRLRPW